MQLYVKPSFYRTRFFESKIPNKKKLIDGK